MFTNKSQQTILIGFTLSWMLISILLYVVHDNLTILDNFTNKIVDEYSVKTKLIYDMRNAIRQRQSILLESSALSNYIKREELRLTFHSLAETFITPHSRLKTMTLNSNENKILAEIGAHLQENESLENKYLQKLIEENIKPEHLNNSLYLATNSQKKIISKLDLLLNDIHSSTVHAELNADNAYRNARIIIFSIGTFVILIIIIISIYTLKKNSSQTKTIQELATIPEDNPSPVFRITTSGRFLFANGAGKKILGEKKLSIGDYAPDEWRKVIRSILSSESNSDTRLEIESFDRIYSFIVTNISENGYVNLYGHDVTRIEQSKRSMQGQIKNNEDQARLPTENPSPVLRISTDGKILFCNQAGTEILEDWSCKTGEYAPVYWHHTLNKLANDNIEVFIYECLSGQLFSFNVVPVPEAQYINLYGHNVTNMEKTLKLANKQDLIHRSEAAKQTDIE